MVKRKLDSTVDKSSADQEICKFDKIEHILWKIWKPAPCKIGSYGKQSGSLADKIQDRLKILKACCNMKYLIFHFVKRRVQHCFSKFNVFSNAFQALQGCLIECEICKALWFLLFIVTAMNDSTKWN